MDAADFAVRSGLKAKAVVHHAKAPITGEHIVINTNPRDQEKMNAVDIAVRSGLKAKAVLHHGQAPIASLTVNVRRNKGGEGSSVLVYTAELSVDDTNPTDQKKMEALDLAVRRGLKAEAVLYLAARSRIKEEQLRPIINFALQNTKDGEVDEVLRRAVDGGLTAEEVVSFAVQSGLTTDEKANILSLAMRLGLYSEVYEVLSLALKKGLYSDVNEVISVRWVFKKMDEMSPMTQRCGFRAEQYASLAVRVGMKVEDLLSAYKLLGIDANSALYSATLGGFKAEELFSAVSSAGLEAKVEVYDILLEQLLASCDKRRKDPELDEWQWPPKPHYYVTEKRCDPRQDPLCPFFLFKMKASAKKGQISWWMKKYPRFPPERAGYIYAMRVARLSIGRNGFQLTQAGEGGQPGALSYCMDASYRTWPRPREGILAKGSSVPLREVAVIKRLPGGDGLSIMSYVYGLGVKLGDILFVLHCPSITVALTFTERSFYVSSKFKAKPLYARTGLDFTDITVPVENLIKKLYRLYQLEEQEKKIMNEKQDHQERQELMRLQEELNLQREEKERKKLEDLRTRRAESKKYRDQRIDKMEAVHRMNERTLKEEDQHQDYDLQQLFLLPEECDLMEPSEELCRNEKMRWELHDGVMDHIVQNYDLLNPGGGGGEARGRRESSPARCIGQKDVQSISGIILQ